MIGPRIILGLLLTLSVNIMGAREGRWAPINSAEVIALADAKGDEWRERYVSRHVLPGAGPDGRARVAALALSTDPVSTSLRETLLKESAAVLNRPIPAYRTPEEMSAAGGQSLFDTRQELWMRKIGDQLVLLSAAAEIRLDDEALRTRLRELALAVCRYPQWGAREPNQDLAAGHVARGLAIAWSWHRELWDGDDAKLIIETVRTRVDTLCGVATSGRHWAGAYQENHNQVNMAAVGLCGVAFLFDLPDHAAKWLAAAQLNFEAVARYSNADGSSPEGVPYWSYGASYILQYIEGVRGVIETDDFYAGDWLRNMADYRLRAATSGFDATLPWGDAPARDYYGPHHMLHRLAAQYRDSNAQYLARQLPFPPQYAHDVTVWNWLWYDPSVPSAPPAGLDGHLPLLDAVDTRSGWGPGDYMLSIKSGYTNRNHSHLDAGALAFAFGGEWLLPAPGYGKGSGQRSFWDAAGGGRWTYFSNATESHTTLLVNGRNQRWDPKARGTVTHFVSVPRAMWTELDLQEAYEGTTSIWRRVLHRRDDYMLVFDDVRLASPGRTEWLLQVKPDAEIDGREARVDGALGSLTVRVLTPDSPLEPRSPDSPNVDVPTGRLKTFSVEERGDEASFRSVLLPMFGGDARTLPEVTALGTDHYKIAGEGWSDEALLSRDAVEWRSPSGDLSATARLILARHDGDEPMDLLAVDASKAVLPMATLELPAASTLSATKINDGLWMLTGLSNTDRDITLKSPWRLVSAGDGNLLLTTLDEPQSDYERWQRALVAVRSQPGIKVRPLPALPPAPQSARIAVEAESFARQISGKADVVDKPGNRGRSLRGFGNDSSFHTVVWKVNVPVAGAYRLRLRYCTPLEGTRVALLVDGAAPSEEALGVSLPRTGGWSVDSDDWREHVLAADDGAVIRLNLTAGEHRLSLSRPSSAINLDCLELLGEAE